MAVFTPVTREELEYEIFSRISEGRTEGVGNLEGRLSEIAQTEGIRYSDKAKGARGVVPAIVRNRVASLFRNVAREGKAVIVENAETDIPRAAHEAMAREGKTWRDVEGLYWDGKVYFIPENMAEPARVDSLILHETAVHYGWRRMLGDKFDATMSDIGRRLDTSLRNKARELGIDVTKSRGVEELGARLAEKGVEPTLWQRFVHNVKQALVRIGFSKFGVDRITENDIRNMILKGRRAADKSGESLRDRTLRLMETAKKKFVTPEQDAEYLAAVERGDIETAQKMVDRAASDAFPNSVARDDDGDLIRVYHGSPNKGFTVFSDQKRGESSGSSLCGGCESPWIRQLAQAGQ